MEIAKKEVEIIFTTSLVKYIQEWYEVRAYRYLLKPIKFDDLKKHLTSCIKEINDKKVNGKMTIVNKKSEEPKINGIKDTTIKVGEVDNFDLLDGITITDDHDNNLKATISGKIEKPSPGRNKKSTITYTVKDSDGNTTQIERLVVVEKGDEVVPPTEELESSLPPVIVEAINNNLVNLNS